MSSPVWPPNDSLARNERGIFDNWPDWRAEGWTVTCLPGSARLDGTEPEPPGGREASQERSGWRFPQRTRDRWLEGTSWRREPLHRMEGREWQG